MYIKQHLLLEATFISSCDWQLHNCFKNTDGEVFIWDHNTSVNKTNGTKLKHCFKQFDLNTRSTSNLIAVFLISMQLQETLH